MIIRTNELLSKHTTIKIGGIAGLYYIPENVLDLQDLIKSQENICFIGGVKCSDC